MIHPDDLPIVYEQLEKAVKTREDWELEFRIITPSNVYKWVRLEAKNDDNSENFGDYGIIRDVTSRKKGQVRVQKQNEILETLTQYDERELNLNSALKGIARSTTMALETGRVSFWTFEQNKNELVTKEVAQLKSGGNSQKEYKLSRSNHPAYFSELEKGKPIVANNTKNSNVFATLQESYLKPNNIVATLNIPIKFRGDIIGILCCENIGQSRNWKEEEIEFAQSIADASTLAFEAEDRKRAKVELEVSERQFRQVTRAVPGAIFKLVTRDWGSQEFEYMSPYAQELFGISKEEIEEDASKVIQMVHPADHEWLMEQYKKNVETQVLEVDLEFRIVLADGKVKWVRMASIVELQR